MIGGDDDGDGTTETQTHSRFADREVACAVVTQKAEDPTFNRCDAGSTPAGGTKRVARDSLSWRNGYRAGLLSRELEVRILPGARSFGRCSLDV